jgi:hypothetical protein
LIKCVQNRSASCSTQFAQTFAAAKMAVVAVVEKAEADDQYYFQ